MIRPPAFARPSDGLRVYPPGVRNAILEAAHSRLSVLLEGETGTGKTYLARIIHELGPRARGPFRSVNCGAIPPSLVEAELFGHDKGAYTDARDSKPGLFEAAHGGTLFLDEIGDFPFAAQAKLLKVVDEGWVRRIGSTREIPVDVRIVCATNQNIEQQMALGRFRADLFFRCCELRIRLPPLREQRDQLRVLVPHLLREIAAGDSPSGESASPAIDDDLIDTLTRYHWPGNIRELRSVLTQAYERAGRKTIGVRHLPLHLHKVKLGGDVRNGATRQTTMRPIKRYQAPPDPAEERRNILRALARTGGNKTRAARLLGMSRHTLWERIRFHRIDDAAWRAQVP